MDTSRLTRDDWLAAALHALADSGSDSLKPERLAKALGVSRGSFYWHFADVTAFHGAIFERWERVAVDTPLGQSGMSDDQSTETALQRLIEIAFTAPSALERAMFRWAAGYPLARAAVARVNTRRLEVLENMFAAISDHPATAATNARILYWTYLGRILLDDEAPDNQVVQQIADMFGLQGGNGS